MEAVDVIIPAYKPGEKFLNLINMLRKQTYPVHKIFVMNTEEKYYNAFRYDHSEIDKMKEVEVHHLSKREFDHGKTRDRGVKKSDAPYFIMMTDDAVPADEYLVERLMNALKQDGVAVAYGRQICSEDADETEAYVRNFNYPEESIIKSSADIQKLGIKTFFCSNVCAAYRRDVYNKLGGFTHPTIFNEDMIYAAKAIDNGYRIAYEAQARVVHFHRYTNKQQFTRNFDLAVSQADHPEVFDRVSSQSEGIKLVKTQIRYLMNHHKYTKIPGFVMQSGAKFMGYKLGKKYKSFPRWFVMKCSMNKEYWR